jgi:RimJ/RimL family protein N-acetyltransferase
MMVNVERTLNTGLCLEVLMNKEIYDSISEDGGDINNIKIDVIEEYWVDVYVNNKTIGVAQFKQMFNKCWDCHIHILPEFRKEYSKEAGMKLLDWCSENLKGSLLYTNVPVFCPNVIAFLKYFDFKEIGLLKGAWKKNGVQNDMMILTRSI